MAEELVLTTDVKLFLSCCGLITYPVLHYIIRYLIRWNAPWLEEKGRAFRISTSIVSGLQSLVVVVISARAVFLCKDVIHDGNVYVHAYIWFGVSYFPYDIIVMFIGETRRKECKKQRVTKSFLKFFRKKPVMVLHHVIFLVVGFPIAEFYKEGIGDFFLCCFLLAEASTPFYSMRCIFKELEIRTGWFYIINGLLFTVAFLFSRVLSVPLMFLRYSYYASLPLLQIPFNIPLKCSIVSVLFFLLQLYWFGLICCAVKNHFFRNPVSTNSINGKRPEHVFDHKQNDLHFDGRHLKSS